MSRLLVLAVVLGLVAPALRAAPAEISIPGEVVPVLDDSDQAALRAFGHDRITHITFHHEGFAGADAALFARASKARLKQTVGQRVRNIHAYHAGEAGLGMFAYHYAIGPDGQIAKGRPVRFKPATRSTLRGSGKPADFAGHFAVMALGDFNHESLTPEARLSLVRVMSAAQRHYLVPTDHIQPHRDHAQTECPGRFIAEEAAALARMTLVYSLQSELVARGCLEITPTGDPDAATQAAFARFKAVNANRFQARDLDDAALSEMLANRMSQCQ